LEATAPNTLPLEETLRITTQICDALAYCHEHGVFHRDIKPENIMLLEDGNVKIIDFGVALLEGARRVTWRGFSGTVGTPDYMAPEQLQGGRGYAGSDIYAVGVMLYEMLCGRVPFEGENVFAVLNQHITQDPPSIRQFNPHISPALETVVMHAIRRDADKRYSTMRAMLNDLTHLDSVTPVPYKPAPAHMDNTRRQIMVGLLITGAIIVILVAIGILAQVLHNVVR
jgi:serine/threonine-protein kinase